MQVRLVKPGASSAPKTKQPPQKDERPAEVQILDTVRSWVNDFRSKKAKGTRFDFQRMGSPAKP